MKNKINNNSINFVFYALGIMGLLFLSACTVQQNVVDKKKSNVPKLFFESDNQDTKIYLTKTEGKDGLVFIPVKRKISKESSLIDDTLRELFLGPTKQEELRGIMTEIPLGTRLIKAEESDDEILIDISSQYLTGGGSAAMQLRYLQIYKTLKDLAPEKKFYLHIDGKPIKAIGGEGLEITQPLSEIKDYTEIDEKNSSVQP